jgi:Spy/CpxP family protein refolding chaperone
MTPEQQEKMDGLRTALVKEMLPLRTDLRVKEIELDALWRADEPDAKKIIAKVKEIGALRVKMEITRIDHRFEMRKLMTPEQRKAMKKMGMHRGMMRGKMGRRMGRGMRGMKRGQMDGQQGPMMGQCGPHGCQDCDMH